MTGAGAPPNDSLIAYLGSRPVGGGSSRGDGTWRIPLLVNERPGAYVVEVKVRGTRTLVETFICYVDVPLETLTPTPVEGGPESASVTPSPPPTDIVASPPISTRTATSVATARTALATTATVAATATLATTTSASTATATRTPPTATVPVSSAKLKISDVFCRDPAYPEDSEYIELVNEGTTTVNLLGWKIVNATRSNLSYTFPSYTVEAGPSVYVTLYSGIGNNQPDFAEFYWGRVDQLWNIGDRAELRDTGGNLIDAYVVPADSCNL